MDSMTMGHIDPTVPLQKMVMMEGNTALEKTPPDPPAPAPAQKMLKGAHGGRRRAYKSSNMVADFGS